jgi:hypothetical protein
MTITSDQQAELSKFPIALQALVLAELTAGNSVVEMGHSFPAPPVGAYCKLERKVTTRERASTGGLHFYERNSSIYSGEFTDADRFYFVIEPANPWPQEMDSDEGRSSPNRSPAAGTPTSDTQNTVVAPSKGGGGMNATQRSERTRSKGTSIANTSVAGTNQNESCLGATYVLHFRDKRTPLEVIFVLEQQVSRLFSMEMEQGKLCFSANAVVVGALYHFRLCFEGASPGYHSYSLTMDVSWGKQSDGNFEYYSKTSKSWFELWTRDFQASNPPREHEFDKSRYAQLCDASFEVQRQEKSVPEIQQSIVAEMKRGARFRTSHKEGGTNIYWRGDRFFRSDYGDDPAERQFTDELSFFTMLRQFCYWDVARNSGSEQLSEGDVWRLILRRMDR